MATKPPMFTTPSFLAEMVIMSAQSYISRTISLIVFEA